MRGVSMSSQYRSGAPIETLKTMQKAKHEGWNEDALSAHHGSSHRNKRAEGLFCLDYHLSQPAFGLEEISLYRYSGGYSG
jgi:hypothetical protein